MKKYNKHRIQKIIEEHGFPVTAKFKGYVLHLQTTNEFIAIIDRKMIGVISFGFSITPESALLFKRYEKAVKEMHEYNKNGVTVCLLFETETQLLIINEP